MFCPKCGSAVPDNARFCPNCAHAMPGAVAPQPAPTPPPIPSGAPAAAGPVSAAPGRGVTLYVVLLALTLAAFLLLPWFSAYSLYTANLFSLGDILGRVGGLVSSMEGGSSLGGMLSGASGVSFLLGAVAVAALGYDMYAALAKGEERDLGARLSLAVLLTVMVVVLSVNSAVRSELGELGTLLSGGAEVVGLAWGWWAAFVLSIALVVVHRRQSGDSR